MGRSKNRFRGLSIEDSISNLLNKAVNNVLKKHVPKARHVFNQRVLAKFVKAMDYYILYTQTHIVDDYKKSMVAFAKVPSLEKIKLSEDFIVLLKVVQKITNIICNNYQKHIPPEDIIEMMIVLVQTCRDTKITGLTIESFSVVSDREKSEKKLTPDCTKFLRSRENLMRTVEKQLETSRQVMKSNAVETKLRNDLRETLARVYPNHELYIFGSRASGQALDDSDFDFYCDVTGNNYVLGLKMKNQSKYAIKVGELLKRESAIFQEVLPIPRARVPIVTLVHKPTNMDCDIGFKDGSGVESTKILKVYLDLDPRVRWVLTAVKLWANDNDIKNNRYFRSHGLSWLVLFYLMKTKLVPPFKDLQKNCEPKLIKGWNNAFTDPKDWWVPDTEATPLELFKGFFRWVVTADLTLYVLSPYTGEKIPKNSFEKMTWLKKFTGMFLNGKSGLCIHDAIEHNQNIVTDVREVLYRNFIDLCSETLDILDDY